MHRASLVLPTLLLISELAIAQARITGPSPKSRSTLDLYDNPTAEQPVKQLPVSEAGFPLQISNSQLGYHQVSINGQAYWVKGANVQISRDSAASCSQVAANKIERVGGTPGAGSDACK